MPIKWKPMKKNKCLKFHADNDNGESVEFVICVKDGKFRQCGGE